MTHAGWAVGLIAMIPLSTESASSAAFFSWYLRGAMVVSIVSTCASSAIGWCIGSFILNAATFGWGAAAAGAGSAEEANLIDSFFNQPANTALGYGSAGPKSGC